VSTADRDRLEGMAQDRGGRFLTLEVGDAGKAVNKKSGSEVAQNGFFAFGNGSLFLS
jgi:hypothetical protein